MKIAIALILSALSAFSPARKDGRLSTAAAVKAGRVKWAHQLTSRQAAEYTFDKVMHQDNEKKIWNPYDNK